MPSTSRLSSVVIACSVDGPTKRTGHSVPDSPAVGGVTEAVRGSTSCPPISIVRQRVEHRRTTDCIQGIAACQQNLYSELLASFDRIAINRRDASKTKDSPESDRLRLLQANNEIMGLQLAIGIHVQELQDLFDSATHVTEVELQD